VILLFVSFQCGCAGSTTGGIKVDRIVIAYKAFVGELRHRVHPTSVTRSRMGGHMLSDKTVKPVLMYIVIYFLAAVVSIFAVMLCGVDPETSVSGVIASIGSVGPGLGELGALDNYSAQPAMAKFIYAFDMFLGRVEIYPVLVAVSMIFGRDRR
jgi:trk system potassium uptake protein TrkH